MFGSTAKILMCAAATCALLSTPVAAAGSANEVSDWKFETIPEPPKAPDGAPNILLIMTDDVGFAATSTFGGPIPMPNYDRLAEDGVRFNAFHTTAMCSPTRAALLTGRNHHRVGFGLLADASTDDPGYNAVIPASAGTIGQVLKANGYDTSWFGKNHNTPPYETTPLGPFDRWPNGLGFDYFYGFNQGMTNQFAPALIENRNVIRPSVGQKDYILDRDMADKAIEWLQLQTSLHPDKPFLMYYAPGTAHSPLQAPRDWIARFKGRFDMGWDKLREQIFERQKAAGVIPADAVLTPRPKEIPAWISLTPDQQRFASRTMEVYAAQLAFFDEQTGRIFEELKQLGRYDNTLIIYIQGDNGASEEAGPKGSNNDYAQVLMNKPDWDHMIATMDDFGGPKSWGSFQAGWGMAMNTPFQWSKEVASHLGGIRNGMVMSWPSRKQGDGEIRSGFTHVVDVAPTIYEAAGITPPEELDRVPQMSLDGVSFLHQFENGGAPLPSRGQYFELLGNRGYYKDGWMANTRPEHLTWDHAPFHGDPYSYEWELYDLSSDFSQATDLAGKYPEKLEELKRAFETAAQANNVHPLRGDLMGRGDPSLRPLILNDRQSVTYYPGKTRYSTYAFPSFLRRGWEARADVDIPPEGAEGTLVAQGGWSMGWGLFVIDGKPVFTYRASDRDPEFRLVGAERLTPGAHTISGRFRRDPANGAGGQVVLSVDGREVSSEQIPLSSAFRMLEASVGMQGEEAVIADHEPPFAFTGKLKALTITLDD